MCMQLTAWLIKMCKHAKSFDIMYHCLTLFIGFIFLKHCTDSKIIEALEVTILLIPEKCFNNSESFSLDKIKLLAIVDDKGNVYIKDLI